MPEVLRERFLKVYANIPLELRKEIVIVFDKEPMTWQAVHVEVLNNTDKSKTILTKLVEMKII